MPKVTEEYRAARRDEIIGAALHLFSRKGFHNTSMADIIAESGLSAGAIYGHFASKAELVQQTVTNLLARRTDDFESQVAAAGILPPAEIVAAFIRGARTEIVDLGLLVQLWAAAVDEPELRAIATTIAESIRAIFRTYLIRWYTAQGLDQEEAAALGDAQSLVCVGICQGFMVQSAIFEDFDGDAYIAAVAGTLPH